MYLIEHGNTTTYEFIYGEKPIAIDEPVNLNLQEDRPNTDNTNEIDFGENIDFGDNGGEIDFGENGGEIDFGDQIVIESPENAEQTIGYGSSRGKL